MRLRQAEEERLRALEIDKSDDEGPENSEESFER